MSVHAPLAPSDAAGWIRCPAKIKAQQGFPDKSSREADEGSAMHDARALCLTKGVDPMDLVGYMFFGGDRRRAFLATEAHMLAILQGIERIYDLCHRDIDEMLSEDPNHVLIERSLRFEDVGLKDVYGTLDFGAYVVPDSKVIVSDLKFGQGVPVYAEHNEQQMIYAALFLDYLTARDRRKVRHVHIIIDQPRISGAGGEWVISVEHLGRWVDEVLYPAVEATKSRDPKYVAGEKQCFWCKAKPTCAAYAEFNVRTLGITFDDERDTAALSSFTVEKMSAERKAYLVKHKAMIEKFLDSVYGSALADALAGREIPGWKAVTGRNGARKWIDAEKTALALSALLGEKAYSTHVISPAEADKLLPRMEMNKLKDLWTQADPKPTLVPVENSKEPVKSIEMDDERES